MKLYYTYSRVGRTWAVCRWVVAKINKLCMIIDRRSGSIINVLFSINSMRVKSLCGHHRQTQVGSAKNSRRLYICISASVSDHRSCLPGKSLIFAALMGSTTELQQLHFIFCFPVSLIFSRRIRLLAENS
jgi:hypothetical protein